MILGAIALPLSLFVSQDFVGLGVAGLGVLLGATGILITLLRINGGSSVAVISLLLCLAALFLGAGSYLLKEHEKTNRALLEKAQGVKRHATATLEDAQQRQAKAEEAPQKAAEILKKVEEAPKKAEELRKKAKEAEDRAIDARKKAEAILKQSQEVKAKTELLRAKAAEDRERAEEARKKTGSLLDDIEAKKQQVAKLQSKVKADREKIENLLKELKQKRQQGEEELNQKQQKAEEQLKQKQQEIEELLKKVKKAFDQGVLKLKSKKAEDRLKAVRGLGKLGKMAAGTERALCELLAVERSPAVREQAINTLEMIRPDLCKHVVTLLLPPEKESYSAASSALGGMGKEAAPAAPIILEHLRKLLISVGKSTAAIVPSDVNYPGLSLASNYMWTLARTAPDDPATIKVLGNVFRMTQFPRLRVAMLLVCNDMTKKNPNTVKHILPYFVAALKDRQSNLRIPAITALGELGSEAKEAIPALRALRFDRSVEVRSAVAKALANIQQNP